MVKTDAFHAEDDRFEPGTGYHMAALVGSDKCNSYRGPSNRAELRQSLSKQDCAHYREVA